MPTLSFISIFNNLQPAGQMKKLLELYNRYKAYVRVDLVMYAVMILLIVLYFIYTVLTD